MTKDYTVFFLNGSQMLLNSGSHMVHDGNGHNLYRYQNGQLLALNGQASLTIQQDGRLLDRNGIQAGYIHDYQGFLTASRGGNYVPTGRNSSAGAGGTSGPSAGTAGAQGNGGAQKKSRKGLLLFIIIVGIVVFLIQNNGSNGHYFYSSRDCGMNGKMKGRIHLICIFVDDITSTWTHSGIDEILNGVRRDTAYLEQQASRYGTSLSVTVPSHRAQVPCGIPTDWVDYVREELYPGSLSLGDLESKLAKQGNYDECSFLFFFNSAGRCVCHQAGRAYGAAGEYAEYYTSTMDSERSIAHELYHLYGAQDYYYPAKVKQAAQKYFPNSSMLVGGREIDDLTAYLIGWTDTLSSTAKAFMNDIADVSKDEIEKAREQERNW